MSPNPVTSSHSAALSLIGLRVLDAAGQPVGDVDAIMVDREDGTVEWVQVRLPGHHGGWVAVPFAGVAVRAGRLIVPHERQWLLDGPRVPGDGALSSRVERALCAFFGPAATTRAAGISAWERRRTSARLRAAGVWEPEARATELAAVTALPEAPEDLPVRSAADAG